VAKRKKATDFKEMGMRISASLMGNPKERLRRRLLMKKLLPSIMLKRTATGYRPWGGRGIGHSMPFGEKMVASFFPEAFHDFCVATGKSSKKDKVAHLYYLDFAWPDIKLDVELDGPYHWRESQRQKDAKRDEWLLAHGWTVFRISEASMTQDPTLERDNIRSTISRLRDIQATQFKDA
jgi:hypothetical protein